MGFSPNPHRASHRTQLPGCIGRLGLSNFVQLRVIERSCFRVITTLLASECVSLARVMRLTEDGLVTYRAEKDHCHRLAPLAHRTKSGRASGNRSPSLHNQETREMKIAISYQSGSGEWLVRRVHLSG